MNAQMFLVWSLAIAEVLFVLAMACSVLRMLRGPSAQNRVLALDAFYVNGMPDALRIEFDRRARRYGMSFDQFVIAVLGHLAWRTPFAEDMEPYDSWLSTERAQPEPPRLRPLH